MSRRSDLNQPIIAEFRANGGNVSGQFADVPLLLLTTTGVRSGQSRTTPLGYTTDGDYLIVVAANGGRATDPDWYRNLLAQPEALVEVGSDRFPVRATIAEGTERQRLYDQHAARIPVFARFPQQTTRQIPVVALERIG
jgi:deazaflavin-dependent oxidoreductase (nitroreductase family)